MAAPMRSLTCRCLVGISALVSGCSKSTDTSATPEKTISRSKFEPVYRASKAIQAATGTGVTYEKFGELLQALSAEIAIAKDQELNQHEVHLMKLYDEALTHYRVSSELWSAKLQATNKIWKGGIPLMDTLAGVPETYDIPTSPQGEFPNVFILPSNSIQIVWQKADTVVDQATEVYYGR